MIKKIILWLIIFFTWLLNTYALEFQVKSGLDSQEAVQLFWDNWKIWWWGYYFRYSYYYDEAWNYKWTIPWWASFPPDYNDRKKTVIDTQYYWYYISSANSWTSDHKQMVVVNKKTWEIYSKRFTWDFYSNYSGSSYIPFFFYNWTVILRLWSGNQWYYFDKWNIEFNIEPWIKEYSWYVTPLTIQWNTYYYANENWSDIYTVYSNIFRGYQFVYDWNWNILRWYTDLEIPNNPAYSRFRINKSNSWIFYLSFVHLSNSVWMKWYDTNSQSWYDYPDKYMLFYNPEVWYGWTVWDYPTTPYYVSETGRIASIWKWIPDFNVYVKYYQKTDKSLYTNDVSIPDTNTNNPDSNPPDDFSSWSTDTWTWTIFDWGTWTWTTDVWSWWTDTWWWIIDTSSWTSNDNSWIIWDWWTTWWDINIDTSWIISSMIDLFWTTSDEINNLKNSLSWALNMWTSWFSVWTWWTSWINYIPWNSDYWTIINRNDNDKTCDMFNWDWSFAYYSNGSYDLSINLNWILDLWYADKVPFLEELLFIPNKILSFITNPLNNIFSTLRVFWWIWENTYCYFGTLQTIEFQKHIMVWASFFWWEIIFTPWTLTIIDYLILFFMWIPMLILTVRILLY